MLSVSPYFLAQTGDIDIDGAVAYHHIVVPYT